MTTQICLTQTSLALAKEVKTPNCRSHCSRSIQAPNLAGLVLISRESTYENALSSNQASCLPLTRIPSVETGYKISAAPARQ